MFHVEQSNKTKNQKGKAITQEIHPHDSATVTSLQSNDSGPGINL
jgi:hypothetical protein